MNYYLDEINNKIKGKHLDEEIFDHAKNHIQESIYNSTRLYF